MNINVCIPAFYPDKKLIDIIERLNRQSVKIQRICIVNTDETGFKSDHKKACDDSIIPVTLKHIEKDEFDHGKTRNLLASLTDDDCEIMIFMTQDAVPYDDALILNLTKPFDVTLLKTTVDNIIKSRQRLKNVYEGKQTVEKKIPKTELQTPDERLMNRVMKTIEQHIFDHTLSVETLASEVGISRVHLNRKLKELTNQTTTDFIKNIRLKRAAELLSQKKHSIAEVADMVGFQNANNFSTAFRKLFGVSPREYMAQKQEE